MAKKCVSLLIKSVNEFIDFVLLVLIIFVIIFGSYAIWDANTIINGATATQFEVFKPSQNDFVSFADLQQKNPETIGWITIYGTLIDYPLMQAENNSKYINTSPNGDYSLTGAIFLDCNNNPNFEDFNSIIYGHNMVPQVMFGGIKEFKELNYFNNHKYGNLFYNQKSYGLEIFSLISIDAYDGIIYSPGVQNEPEKQKILDYLRMNSQTYRDINVTTYDKIVLLSTCSNEGTNARDILVAKITDKIFDDVFEITEEEKTVIRIDENNIKYDVKTVLITGLVFVVILTILIIIYRLRKNFKKRAKNYEE